MLTERYTNLDLCSEAADTSFVRNQDELEDDEAGKDENEEGNDATKKAKLVVEDLKLKIPTSRSQTQVITELGKSIDRSIEAQTKRAKLFVDEERERHSAYLKFKEEEGERNRKHDLEIAKIYAEAMRSPTVRVPQGMPLREEAIHVPTGLSQQPNDISEHKLYPTTLTTHLHGNENSFKSTCIFISRNILYIIYCLKYICFLKIGCPPPPHPSLSLGNK